MLTEKRMSLGKAHPFLFQTGKGCRETAVEEIFKRGKVA